MRIIAVFVMLGIAACGNPDARVAGVGSAEMQGWRFVSGKRPTHAEYNAIVSACRDGAVTRSRGKPLDGCLADLGLRRE